ncbi:MAG: arginine repressor [Chloracidobacterium sp.]|uniref:Arginine repressor n=1 Tax=Chloracidobacterium validum TaxID=2821543 RepID=A0ABX8BF65_9BACT|nr:arginine repressor [Chloracidobacterium validum]QUW04626.1 arginine repressor [Chloracidobacterium validum]
MEKAERQQALLELIERERLSTQADLRAALAARYGIICDQGTISRDIKELGLVRFSDANGAYYGRTMLTFPSSNETFLLSRLVRRAQAAENLIVVHTDAANAHPVAEALDRLAFPEVIGTVAGDNTVLVVVKNAAAARRLAERIVNLAGVSAPAGGPYQKNGQALRGRGRHDRTQVTKGRSAKEGKHRS